MSATIVREAAQNPLYHELFPGGKRAAQAIVSICSANSYVLRAALERAARAGRPALIEATANQVDQNGGYTGMTPQDFVRFVEEIAEQMHFPKDRLVLGGDHLGPLVWRSEEERTAMDKAETLVRAYVGAGFTKIHLDTSMRLKDDDPERPFPPEVAARRTTRLLAACEAAWQERRARVPSAPAPVYVIGSEVPVPGGTVSDEALSVTSVADFENVVRIFSQAFRDAGLDEALSRVVAVVVQPGVEFGNADVHEYDACAARALMEALAHHPGLVFEGHSTDYQTREALHDMARDGVVIQKVGPALTFALREGLYALSKIEELLAEDGEETSQFLHTLEQAMLEEPKYWQAYYRGTPKSQARERIFGQSDRCRYYLSDARVRQAMGALIRNLERKEIPYPLLSQFLPLQYEKIRAGQLENRPEALLIDKVGCVIDSYIF